MIGDYLKFEKSAIMHVCLGEPITKVPGFLWWFVLQVVFTLLLPPFYPATQETMDLIIRAQMLAVNALLILIITSFVSKVLVLTYSKNMEQREMIRSQYQLSIGDVDSIAASLQNDCLIVQKDGETADEYTARLEQAKQAASKTYWVIGIARFSPFIVMYLHPFADAKVGSRAVLAWESDLPNDQKIVAPDYNFAIETKENYARYIAYFVKGWRDNGAMFKMKMFEGDAETQTKIAQKTVSDNN
jgi:hypothetical protein